MRWTCPSDKLLQAQATVEAAFSTATEEKLAEALYLMRVVCRGRDGETRTAGSGEVEIAAWVLRLKDYPADVAISCIQDWPKHSSWWPTWHELRQRLEAGVSQRRIMRHIVGQLIRQQGVKPVEAQPETEERRAQVVADALSALTDLGPFKATKPRGDTVSGRTVPTDAEAVAAERHLERIMNERGSASGKLSLSPMALAKLGIKPPEPPERTWDTNEEA